MAEKNYQLSMANLLRKSDKNFPPRDSKIIFLEPGLLSNRTLNPKERSPLTYRGAENRLELGRRPASDPCLYGYRG